VDTLVKFGVVPTVNGCLQQGMEAMQFFIMECWFGDVTIYKFYVRLCCYNDFAEDLVFRGSRLLRRVNIY